MRRARRPIAPPTVDRSRAAAAKAARLRRMTGLRRGSVHEPSHRTPSGPARARRLDQPPPWTLVEWTGPGGPIAWMGRTSRPHQTLAHHSGRINSTPSRAQRGGQPAAARQPDLAPRPRRPGRSRASRSRSRASWRPVALVDDRGQRRLDPLERLELRPDRRRGPPGPPRRRSPRATSRRLAIASSRARRTRRLERRRIRVAPGRSRSRRRRRGRRTGRSPPVRGPG